MDDIIIAIKPDETITTGDFFRYGRYWADRYRPNLPSHCHTFIRIQPEEATLKGIMAKRPRWFYNINKFHKCPDCNFYYTDETKDVYKRHKKAYHAGSRSTYDTRIIKN